jgi:hypothetical protein
VDDPNTTFTFTSASFTLAPGQEAYKCQNFKNTIGKDVAIVSTEVNMAKGSHHMFVFHDPSYQAGSGLTDCSGVEFHDYLVVAQVPHETLTYPDNVGRSLKGTEGLRILAHYLNTTADPITANIQIKFKFVDPSAVKWLGGQMFLNNVAIFVGPGASTKTSSFRVPYDINMLFAVSHMHARGTRFQATTNTGQTIYDGNNWDEPTENKFNPPMLIKAGSTITWSCDYVNNTQTTYTFGESANTNEMCILNALFYPQDTAHNGAALDG